MSIALSLIAAAFYIASIVMLTRTFKTHYAEVNGRLPFGPEIPHKAKPETTTATNRPALIFATVAAIIHGWLVIKQSGLPNEFSLPFFTSVSATTLTIVLLHIALCLRQPADYLGLAVYPLAAISLIVNHTSGGGTPILGSAIQIHVLLSLVSYGVLALAAAQAVLVAIQRHFLAIHKPGGFLHALPPLDTTERLLFTLLSAGFTLLSLALFTGFLFLDDMFGQHLAHKTILSCIGWAIFGILLFGRWQFGWRGKKAVHWTLGGFGVLILAYFGTKFVIEVLLN